MDSALSTAKHIIWLTKVSNIKQKCGQPVKANNISKRIKKSQTSSFLSCFDCFLIADKKVLNHVIFYLFII